MTTGRHAWEISDIVEDVSAGDWIPAAIRSFGAGVGALVPPVFAAYSRLLHPAYGLRDPNKQGWRSQSRARWRTVAEHTGAVIHPTVEWGSILEAGIRNDRGDGRGVVWATSPDTGQLDPHDLAVAADILAKQTSCPDDCWFGFWEGLGFNDVDGPRMALPERHHILFHGTVNDAITQFQGFVPSIWWPADRAWFVATDVDLMSTYVGSTTECASLLRDSRELEAIETSVDRATWWDSDTINPLPPKPI